MRFKLIVLIIILSLLSILLFSESLWNDKAKNLYSRKINFIEGDSVTVIINETSLLDYKSNTKTTKSYSINVTGKNITGIIDFLPKGSVEESKNGANSDKIKLNYSIQAKITAIDGNIATLQGSKTFIIDNKQTIVALLGDVNISDISANSVFSSKLLDAQIKIVTLLENNNAVVNNSDIVDVITNPDSTGDKIIKSTLSDTKQKELLRKYFNKILGTIF